MYCRTFFQTKNRVFVPTVVCFAALLADTIQADSPPTRYDRTSSIVSAGRPDPVAQDVTAKQPGKAAPVRDMVLHAGGILHGRVELPGEKAQPVAAAGYRVSLLDQKQVVATTVCDAQGRFVFRAASTGIYRMAIETPGGTVWRLYRVWQPAMAPPRTPTIAAISVIPTEIRGQSPFPVMSFRQAATLTAVAAGAVAAPLIYRETRQRDQIPAAPSSP